MRDTEVVTRHSVSSTTFLATTATLIASRKMTNKKTLQTADLKKAAVGLTVLQTERNNLRSRMSGLDLDTGALEKLGRGSRDLDAVESEHVFCAQLMVPYEAGHVRNNETYGRRFLVLRSPVCLHGNSTSKLTLLTKVAIRLIHSCIDIPSIHPTSRPRTPSTQISEAPHIRLPRHGVRNARFTTISDNSLLAFHILTCFTSALTVGRPTLHTALTATASMLDILHVAI